MSKINPKLLEVAFFQEGYTDTYTFTHDAMFIEVDDMCDIYDFTDELPESEHHYTTFCDVCKNSRYRWIGKKYLVTEDFTGSYAIYKYVE